MRIAASHQRNVLRDAQPGFEDRLHRTHCRRVVIAEHAVRQRCQAEQFPHRLMAALFARLLVVVQRDQVLLHRLHSPVYKGAAVTGHSSGGGANHRSADVRNAPAAYVSQMAGAHQAECFVVHADEVGRQAGEPPIYQNVRRLLLLNPAEAFFGPLGGGHHQRVHVAAEQLVDFLLFEVRVLFRRRDHQVVAVLPKRTGQAAGNQREERLHQVGDHQPYDVGAACD